MLKARMKAYNYKNVVGNVRDFATRGFSWSSDERSRATSSDTICSPKTKISDSNILSFVKNC